MITRAEWGARPPSRRLASVPWHQRTAFMVHHSGGPAGQSVKAIQEWAMDGRGFSDIFYNLLITPDGRLFEGRGMTRLGAHCVGWNRAAIGVCLIGDDLLTAAARETLRATYLSACRKSGRTLDVLGHRDKAVTDCPGTGTLRWLRSGGLSPRTLRPADPPMRGDDVRRVQDVVGVKVDGIYGPRTTAAVKAWQRAHELVADGIVGPLTRAAMGI